MLWINKFLVAVSNPTKSSINNVTALVLIIYISIIISSSYLLVALETSFCPTASLDEQAQCVWNGTNITKDLHRGALVGLKWTCDVQ